jgi:hypothetical protein
MYSDKLKVALTREGGGPGLRTVVVDMQAVAAAQSNFRYFKVLRR